MKLGLVTSVYVNYPLEEAISRVAAAGYDCIDIWGGRPHAYRRDYDRAGLVGLRNRVAEAGLKVSSFVPAFFRYPHSLSSPNPIVRLDTLDYVRQCADNAAVLEAEHLLICPARLLFGQSAADGWKRLADSLNTVCEYVAQYPIKIVLEPVNIAVFDLINTCAEAMRMVHQLNCTNLGVVLDTGHLHLSRETIDEALDIVGERLFIVHVNDNDGKRQQNLIPGDGTFDFAAFFTGLRRRGFDGVVSAELSAEYALAPDSPVQETARRLRPWVDGDR